MKDNVSLVAELVLPSSLIGKFIKLKALNSKSFIGICPFHNEKTPSFRVDDEKKFFYCFGCHKGGDIFKFLQEYRNISFPEALKEIAESYGIKLATFKAESKETLEEKTILEKVCELFASQLKTENGLPALHYLKQKRKLTDEIIADFKIGFCPKESDFLLSYFPEKIDELLKLGLIGKKIDGSFYSTFAGRVMFPICGLKGEVLAFGGRIFTKEQEEHKLAKYINSKESELFKKNRVIYGLQKAKKTKFPLIVVEGYLDVIKMHQNGFKSTVAQMGTAFSEEQIKILFTSSNEIIFCYDSDEAGRKAERRSVEMCLPFISPEKTLSFLVLETKDADEFLTINGRDKMEEKLQKRIPLYERIFQLFSEEINFSNPNQMAMFESKVLAFCEKITDAIVKKNYQSYIKNKIFQMKKIPLKSKPAISLEKSEFSSKDCLLFALFLKFPDFFKSDYYLENFVPFSSKKLEKIVNGELFDIAINEEIAKKYPLKITEPKSFYQKIYADFVLQNLNEEKSNALKINDFARVKEINLEIERLKRGA
jgi:DNA primase